MRAMLPRREKNSKQQERVDGIANGGIEVPEHQRPHAVIILPCNLLQPTAKENI
jgi:hypothetical protein